MSEHSDPDAPPTEEEIRDSERLRDALEKNSAHEGAELLRAVKSAAAPRALDEHALESAVSRGLAGFDARKKRNATVIRVVFGVAAMVAVAAALLVIFGRPISQPEARAPELVKARSTQTLFTERFETHGGESARIDRIALARAADLRENQFAKWGVPRSRK